MTQVVGDVDAVTDDVLELVGAVAAGVAVEDVEVDAADVEEVGDVDPEE